MKKLDNYRSNLKMLEKANTEDLENDFIIGGIIDKFFLQFELGWKVMKELLRYEGRNEANTGSPRDIIKAAYTVYPSMDERLWVSMLRDRNDMTHIYNGNAARELVDKIIDQYIPEFQSFDKTIERIYSDETLESMR